MRLSTRQLELVSVQTPSPLPYHMPAPPAHSGRVESIIIDKVHGTTFSIARDKTIRVHKLADGSIVASQALPHVPSCMFLDVDAQTVFLGDQHGGITLLKLEGASFSTVSTLEGHECEYIPIVISY